MVNRRKMGIVQRTWSEDMILQIGRVWLAGHCCDDGTKHDTAKVARILGSTTRSKGQRTLARKVKICFKWRALLKEASKLCIGLNQTTRMSEEMPQSHMFLAALPKGREVRCYGFTDEQLSLFNQLHQSCSKKRFCD